MLRLLGSLLTCKVVPGMTDDAVWVLAAVKRDGRALRYASPRLRASAEVVSAAVAHTGDALYWASDELRATKAIVLIAIKQDLGARVWIKGDALWHDPDVQRALRAS